MQPLGHVYTRKINYLELRFNRASPSLCGKLIWWRFIGSLDQVLGIIKGWGEDACDGGLLDQDTLMPLPVGCSGRIPIPVWTWLLLSLIATTQFSQPFNGFINWGS